MLYTPILVTQYKLFFIFFALFGHSGISTPAESDSNIYMQPQGIPLQTLHVRVMYSTVTAFFAFDTKCVIRKKIQHELSIAYIHVS
jgi:hypothetical protein